MKKQISMKEAYDLILTKIFIDFTELQSGKKSNYNPILLEGTYGIGKTTILKSIPQKLKEMTGLEWGFIKWNMATMSVHQLQGIPKLNIRNFEMVTDESIPTEVNKGSFPEQGILYLDEINHIEDPIKISVLHSLLQENTINNMKLPDKWFIVASGNSQNDLGLFYKLPPGVRDRLLIYDVSNPIDDQLAYYRNSNVHPIVISFIETNLKNGKDITQTFDPEKEINDDDENYVFITRRSLEDASKTIYGFEKLPPNLQKLEVLENLICGSIGKKYGTQLFASYKNQGLTSTKTEQVNLANSPTNSTPQSLTFQTYTREEILHMINTLEFNQNGITPETHETYMKIISSPSYAELNNIDVVNEVKNAKLVLCLLTTNNALRDKLKYCNIETRDAVTNYVTSRNIIFSSFAQTNNM